MVRLGAMAEILCPGPLASTTPCYMLNVLSAPSRATVQNRGPAPLAAHEFKMPCPKLFLARGDWPTGRAR